MFSKVLIKLLGEQNSKRMYRKDMVELFNKRINDKRLNINKFQLNKVIAKQNKYNIKPIGRNEYEFDKKNSD